MDLSRRLAWHGMILFVLGLLMGLVVQNVTNPRMGLSAHVGTVLNGVLVIALGAVWKWVALPPRTASVTYWLIAAGSYVSCLFLFLAAVFGTSSSTPLGGAGFKGTPLQEAIVASVLIVGAIAVLIGAVLATWGLRPGAVTST